MVKRKQKETYRKPLKKKFSHLGYIDDVFNEIYKEVKKHPRCHPTHKVGVVASA